MPRLWCLFLLPFLGDTLKSLRKHLRNKMHKMISVSAKIPIKPHAHPETQPGWPIFASRAAAETHWEMPWSLQSVLCLRHLCLESSVCPPAPRSQASGFSSCDLWPLYFQFVRAGCGVLGMHAIPLTVERTMGSTLCLNISSMWPWQRLQALLSFLLRLLLVFALAFSLYLPAVN